ncbi:MAG: hypothetical protein VB934_00940, partial [Polyangiaceae bacterium]
MLLFQGEALASEVWQVNARALTWGSGLFGLMAACGLDPGGPDSGGDAVGQAEHALRGAARTEHRQRAGQRAGQRGTLIHAEPARKPLSGEGVCPSGSRCWLPQQVIQSPLLSQMGFGENVATDGQTILIANPDQDPAIVYYYDYIDRSFQPSWLIGELVPYRRFGTLLAVDGDVAMIGARPVFNPMLDIGNTALTHSGDQGSGWALMHKGIRYEDLDMDDDRGILSA